MAYILYLSIASALPLILCVQSLLPLIPLLSFQPCSKLHFPPNKLSGFQIAIIILFLFLKPSLKQLRVVPSLKAAHAEDSRPSTHGAFELPDIRLTMPVMVSRADMECYERATRAPNNASPTSGANSMFLLSPVTEPLMLLLLTRPACPILPLGSVNVRNRFEFLSPSECKTVSLRTRLRAEASLRRKGRRVKRGMEFDVVIEAFGEDTGYLIFRQVMTILQFLNETVEPRWQGLPQKEAVDVSPGQESAYELLGEEAVTLEEAAPSIWAALCKDYNPIHISAIAARLFGFPGKIAHGNHAAAMMMEGLASSPESANRNLWLDSNRASFMEVEFRRPMVVPLQLCVKVAPVASTPEPDQTNRTIRMACSRIDTWANIVDLDDKIRHVAKTHYKRIHASNSFEDRSQDAILAGCIFIACRECNAPRTFSEIQGFTRVSRKEIGGVYKSLERFLAAANDEIVLRFHLYGRDKSYVEGRIGWLRIG